VRRTTVPLAPADPVYSKLSPVFAAGRLTVKLVAASDHVWTVAVFLSVRVAVRPDTRVPLELVESASVNEYLSGCWLLHSADSAAAVPTGVIVGSAPVVEVTSQHVGTSPGLTYPTLGSTGAGETNVHSMSVRLDDSFVLAGFTLLKDWQFPVEFVYLLEMCH
jgi:hypothetical protein